MMDTFATCFNLTLEDSYYLFKEEDQYDGHPLLLVSILR